MAIEVPPAVQNLFLVLTGEKWPQVNEDDLRVKGNAWGDTGDALNNDLIPLMVQAVQTIRLHFTGKAAIKFGEKMAPYVVDEPRYLPQIAEQAQVLKNFLLEASTQVEYVKIISIEEVILLIAQIAWAIAAAFWTGGQSMVWLAGRMAIVRFLLQSWWGRLILQFVIAELLGIAFQLALDVLTQAIQFAKGTRHKWDVQATIGAVEVGAIGGLFSLPFNAISHVVAAKVTKVVVSRMHLDSGRVLAAVEQTMSNNAKGFERFTIPTLGREITMDILRSADMPMKVKIAAVGVHALTETVEEGLHEAITEGTVKAINGQGFSFNPYSFTSGVASHISEEIGHGLAHVVVPEKIQAKADPHPAGEDDRTPLLDPASEKDSGIDDTGTDSGSELGADSDTGSEADFDPTAPPVTAVTNPLGSATPPGQNPATGPQPPVTSGTRTPAPSANTASQPATTSRDTAGTPQPRPTTPATTPRSSTPAPSTTTSSTTTSSTTTSSTTGPSTTSPSTTGPSTRSGQPGQVNGENTARATSTGANGRTTPSPATSATPTPAGGRNAAINGVPESTTRSSTTTEPQTPATAGRQTGANGLPRTTSDATRTPGSAPSSTETSTTPRATSETTPGTTPRATSQTTPGTTGRGTGSAGPGRPVDTATRATAPNPTTSEHDRPGGRPDTASVPAPATTSRTSDATVPTELTEDAVMVSHADLDRVTRADVANAGRVVVLSPEPVPPETARTAAERLGVDVVARVDRERIGNGRRKGRHWMIFPPGGGRPRPLNAEPGPIVVTTEPATPAPEVRDGIRRSTENGGATRVAPARPVNARDTESVIPPEPEPSRESADLMSFVRSALTSLSWRGGSLKYQQIEEAREKLPGWMRKLPLPQLADRIAQVIRTGAPMRMRGGAIGLEFETPFRVHIKGDELYGKVLAVNERAGYRATVDSRPFYVDTEGNHHPTLKHLTEAGKTYADTTAGNIVEFISEPFGMSGQPQDERPHERESVLRSFREDLDRLQRRSAQPGGLRPVPLDQLFQKGDGWTIMPGGRDARIELLPVTTGRDEETALFGQYTAGVPLTELHDFLKYAKSDGPHRGTTTISETLLDDGLGFADRVAAMFVAPERHEEVSGPAIDLLRGDAEVAALRGFLALVYPHLATQARTYIDTRGRYLMKNGLLVASRTSFAGMRGKLPDAVKTFLEDKADDIRAEFVATFRSRFPNFDQDLYQINEVPPEDRPEVLDILDLQLSGSDGELRVGQYLDNALLPEPGVRIGQDDGVGVFTHFEKMDTNDERLGVPLALLEMRSFGPYPLGITEADRQVANLDQWLGAAYDRAGRAGETSRGARRKEDLRRAVRLLGPAERDTAPMRAFASVRESLTRIRPAWRRVDARTELLSADETTAILLGLDGRGEDGRSEEYAHAALDVVQTLHDRLRAATGRVAAVRSWADQTHRDLDTLAGHLRPPESEASRHPEFLGSRFAEETADLANAVTGQRVPYQDGREELLGADPFAVRRAPAAPAFLTGYRYADLHANRRAAFFSAIDLAATAVPTPARLRRLRPGPVSEGARVPRNNGRGDKTQKVPHVIHAIWFGKELYDDGGPRKSFMDNLAAEAARDTGFEVVLWTDVTRAEFAAARDAETAPAGERETRVREMLHWARTHRVRLVNIDEVFNAQAPMVMDGQVRTERARGNPTGYAAASDLARAEILRRFGGVYSDGDNVLVGDPRRAADAAARTVDGFAVSRDRHGLTSNAVLAAAAGSSGIRAYQAVLEENFAEEHANVMINMMYPDADASAISRTERDELNQGNATRTRSARDTTAAKETMARTGPNGPTFDRVAEALGHEERAELTAIPEGVFTIESAQSWLASQPQAQADLATLTRSVVGAVTSLHRELRARPGGLYLPAAARTVDRLPLQQREQVWQVALQTFHDTLPPGTHVDWISAHGVPLSGLVHGRIDELFPGATKVGFTQASAPVRRPEFFGDTTRTARSEAWPGQPRLSDALFARRFPHLPKINPDYRKGGDFATNCVLAAKYADNAFAADQHDPDVYHQVPPMKKIERRMLPELVGASPVDLPGYEAVVEVMTKAGPGARGLLIIGRPGSDTGHVVNVVHGEDGVVFLDAQEGAQAVLPAVFQSLEFIPTSENFPTHLLPDQPSGVPHPDLLGGTRTQPTTDDGSIEPWTWFTLTRSSVAGDSSYEVSETGWIAAGVGDRTLMLAPDEWVRRGSHFLHLGRRVALDGRTGAIRRAHDEDWAAIQREVDDGDLAPYAARADRSGLYFDPVERGAQVRLPLTDRPAETAETETRAEPSAPTRRRLTRRTETRGEHSDDSVAEQAEPVPLEELLDGVRLSVADGRVVGLWLPGTRGGVPRFSDETLGWLNPPAGAVFVFGRVANGQIMVGDRTVSAEALTAVIAARAPGLAPILWMPGATALAGPLAESLGEPVMAAPHGLRWDKARGMLVSQGPTKATSAKRPKSEWFQLFVPGDRGGRPVSPELPVALRHDETAQPAPGKLSRATVGVPDPTDPMVRSIGVPRAGLPNLPQLIRAIKESLPPGTNVPPEAWAGLPQRLVSNYPYLLESVDKDGVSGLLVPFGDAELLITLDPTEPHRVSNAAGSTTEPSTLPAPDGAHKATGAINAAYATGAHADTHTGRTGGTRVPVALTFGIGATPHALQVVKAGMTLSGTMNQSTRSTTRIVDAEGGHVEDNRADSTLLSYRPNWSFKVRTNPREQWDQIAANEVADPGKERLLLWVPDHYKRTAPEQVTATGPGVRRDRLPDTFFASGLTSLPKLFDQIAGQLQNQGVDLPIGGFTREALLQKLWNLNMHLDEAVNNKKRGYSFVLEDERGRKIAVVDVHAQRIPFRTPRVGETSDKAHLENVRTAIDGVSGGHTITNSTTVTGAVEFDAMPNPLKPDVGLGVSGYVSGTWSNTDAISSGRTGLWVLVPRYAGHTSGYHAQFSYTAGVRVRGFEDGAEHLTKPVVGQALLRMPENAAYEHGFPIDKAALRKDPGERTRVRFEPDAVRAGKERDDPTAKPEQDPDKPVPAHIAEGKGVGMGLVKVPRSTVDLIRKKLEPILRERGFLPPEDDPFGERHWWQHADDLDSQIDNQLLLEKMISVRGLDTHYDEIHQDGMPFTLRRRRGFAGMTLDVDSAKIVIRAKKSTDRSKQPKYVRSTDEFHTVNLAMGMDTAGQSTGGSKKLAVGVKFKALFQWLKTGLTGVELQKTVGATDAVNFLNNRPELLEYPGVVDEFALTSDYEISVEFEHSGTQGNVREHVRDPDPIEVKDQTAVVHVLPLVNVPPPVSDADLAKGSTPAKVLDQAVIYHLDTSGLVDILKRSFRKLFGAAGAADQELSSVASTIQMRAHLKEAVNGEYTTDQPFEPGLLRDTAAGVDISGELKGSAFAGATKDKFVLGIIKLWLAQATTTDSSSKGVSWDELDGAFGGEAGHASLTGEFDLNRHWQWNRSKSKTTTGGKELIQLDFNRAYAYRSKVDLTVRARKEKRGKLAWSSYRYRPGWLTNRSMMYLLPEPEALARYAEGVLPVSDAQLADAMYRWSLSLDPKRAADADPPALVLSGDTVAKILTRWAKESPKLARMPEIEKLTGSRVFDRDALAEMLAEAHEKRTLHVVDPATREAFDAAFGARLADRDNPYRDMEMPEYLSRQDPGGRILGHHGVYDLTFGNGKSMYKIVKEQVDRVAPGMLAADPQVWYRRSGQKLGRLHGGIDSLQALLARGRDQAMFEDLHDLELTFVNTSGWFGSDIVRVKLNDVLTSLPRVKEFKPSTGLENYDHHYLTTSHGKSRDAGQTLNVPKLAIGRDAVPGDKTPDPPPSGPAVLSLKASEGHHRGTTRSENAVKEQTTYAWDGHYRVEFDHELTVAVERLDMSGRPLNNWYMNWLDRWTGHSTKSTVTERGALEIEVPRAIAEAGVARGPSLPRHFVPLPKLPDNSYVAGTLLGDTLAIARKLLNQVFGRKADDVRTRSALSLPTRFLPSHLSNQMKEMTGGDRYEVARDLFIPGHSSDRATMWMAGDLYDLQVVAPVKEGTGTGAYRKHQSGTTANSSSDHWRADMSVTGDPTGTFQPHTPPRQLTGETSGSRSTAAGQGSAGTENYRREGHVKEQGPVYMVRLRGRFRMEADKFHHPLFGKRKPRGHFRGDPVTGDVYVTMFQAQVDELRAQLAAKTEQAEATAPPFPEMDGVRPSDLRHLLVAGAHEGYDTFHAYQGLARRLRDEGGGSGPVALTFDQAAAEWDTYRSVLRWAVRTMEGDYVARRRTEPGLPIPAELADYRSYRGMGTLPAALRGQSMSKIVSDITVAVNRYHSENPRNAVKAETDRALAGPTRGRDTGPLVPPVALPPEVAVLGLDPTYLMRDIAHELDTHVRLDIVRRDGTVVRRWADGDGRVYHFDPTGPEITRLTADEAQDAGLMPARLRPDADELDVNPADLARVYRTSWLHQRTFEQELLTEFAERRSLLASRHADLPDLLTRTWQARRAVREAVRALARRQAALDRRIAAAERETNAAYREAFDANAPAALTRRIQESERESLGLKRSGDELRQGLARARADAREIERTLTDLWFVARGIDERPGVRRTPAQQREAARQRLARRRALIREGGEDPFGLDAEEPHQWDGRTVRSIGDRLAGMEDSAVRLLDQHIGEAFRLWTGPSVSRSVVRLRRVLLDAGPGALSLVVTRDTQGARRDFTVVNEDGRIRWYASGTGRVTAPPTNSGTAVASSLDLDPRGDLIAPSPGLAAMDLGTSATRWVRDRALAGVRRPAPVRQSFTRPSRSPGHGTPAHGVPPEVVVDDPVPDDPRLYVDDRGRHRIAAPGLPAATWREAGALSVYAPLSWLTHVTPSAEYRAADVARADADGAVRYFTLAQGRPDAADAARAFLATAPGRTAERHDTLPSNLPPDTWIWFHGRTRGTGAALVLPGGGYRIYQPSTGSTLTSTGPGVPASLSAPGTTYVIARPAKAGRGRPPGRSTGPFRTRLDTLDESDESDYAEPVSKAETAAMARHADGFDPNALRRRVAARGLVPVDVDRDGNCFYASLLVIAGPALLQQVPGLAAALRGEPGDGIRLLRERLANRLEEDFARGEDSMYANAVVVPEGRSARTARANVVRQIRNFGVWDNQAGDLVAALAANEFGLPLTVIQYDGEAHLGPDGEPRIYFIRRIDHFQGTRPANGVLQDRPWGRFTPRRANEGDQEQTASASRRFTAAIEDFTRARGELPAELRDRHDLDAETERIRFQDALDETYPDVPAYVGRQLRADAINRAASNLERLTALARAAGSTTERTGAETRTAPHGELDEEFADATITFWNALDRVPERGQADLGRQVDGLAADFDRARLSGSTDVMRALIQSIRAATPAVRPARREPPPASLHGSPHSENGDGRRAQEDTEVQAPADTSGVDAPTTGVDAFTAAGAPTAHAADPWNFRSGQVHWRERYAEHALAPINLIREHYNAFRALNSVEYNAGLADHMVNCVNVAVGVVETLEGRPFTPFASDGPRPIALLERHFGAPVRPMRDPDEIVERLLEAGPGSHGIVVETRPNGDSHVFNAIHDTRLDAVVLLDAQSGRLASVSAANSYGLLLTSGRPSLERRLTDVLPPHDGIAADCLVRLDLLREHFYGAGARVTRDDSAVGTGRDQDTLAAAVRGAWQPVGDSLATVVDRLRALGDGAVAFVLTSPPSDRRPPHGFALRNEGGRVFSIETQNAPGHRVSAVDGVPAGRFPAARAIVVDPAGRAAPLTGLGEPASTLNALVDPARELRYGAVGLELETSIAVSLSGVELDYNTTLAVNRRNGWVAKVDHRPFYVGRDGRDYPTTDALKQANTQLHAAEPHSVIEFVSSPFGVTRQPQDVRPADRNVVLRSIRDLMDRLRRESARHPGRRMHRKLSEVLRAEDGWVLEPGLDEAEATVMPFRDANREIELFPQTSAGVPLTELYDFFKYVRADVRRETPYTRGEELITEGIEFADRITADFVRELTGQTLARPVIDALSANIDAVSALRGFAVAVYSNLAAAIVAYRDEDDALVKNNLAALLRTSVRGIRTRLPDEAKTFLRRSAGAITQEFVATFRRAHPTFDQDYLRSEKKNEYDASGRRVRVDILGFELIDAPDGWTMRDYLENALYDTPRRVIKQSQVFGPVAEFAEVDTNDGRLGRPLAVLELRTFGAYHAGITNILTTTNDLDIRLRDAYDEAQERSRRNDARRQANIVRAVRGFGTRRRAAGSPAALLGALQYHLAGLFDVGGVFVLHAQNLADIMLGLDGVGTDGREAADAVRTAVDAVRNMRTRLKSARPGTDRARGWAGKAERDLDAIERHLQRKTSRDDRPADFFVESYRSDTQFATGVENIPAAQLRELDDFMGYIVEDAIRRYEAGLPEPLVHVEGGDLAGGTARARSVTDGLRGTIEARLGARGMPRDIVLFAPPTARGEGRTASPDDVPDGTAGERRRTVMMWTGTAVRPVGQVTLIRADLTDRVEREYARVTGRRARLDWQQILRAYEGLPVWAREQPLRDLGRWIVQAMLDGERHSSSGLANTVYEALSGGS